MSNYSIEKMVEVFCLFLKMPKSLVFSSVVFILLSCNIIADQDDSPGWFSYPSAVHLGFPVTMLPTWREEMRGDTADLTYSISPSFSNGLSFNTSSGEISGIATNDHPSSYVVTAFGPPGSLFYTGTNIDSVIVNIRYPSLSMLSLTYSNIGVSYDDSNNADYTINISNNPNPTINDVIPQWRTTPSNLISQWRITPTDVTYDVDPDLPNWLSFGQSDGVISKTGTPTSAYYREYTITATGVGDYQGSKQSKVIVAISVNADNGNIRRLVAEQIKDQEEISPDYDVPENDIIVENIPIIRSITTPNLNIIDTSMVTDMTNLFFMHQLFNGDVSGWNTANVTNMEGMFELASSFNGDISDWDVGNVRNMKIMFKNATAFTGDISGWDVDQVTSMDKMFNGATAFTQDLEPWGDHLKGRTVVMTNMFTNSGVAGKEPTWCTTARSCK